MRLLRSLKSSKIFLDTSFGNVRVVKTFTRDGLIKVLIINGKITKKVKITQFYMYLVVEGQSHVKVRKPKNVDIDYWFNYLLDHDTISESLIDKHIQDSLLLV